MKQLVTFKISDGGQEYESFGVYDHKHSDKKVIKDFFGLEQMQEDYLYKNNVLMHIKMREKGIKHEFRVRDGDHNWDYWRSALPSVLEFISKKFH